MRGAVAHQFLVFFFALLLTLHNVQISPSIVNWYISICWLVIDSSIYCCINLNHCSVIR
jgi:hypothetical protein